MVTLMRLAGSVRLASIAVATAGALTGQAIAQNLNPQPEPPGTLGMPRSIDMLGLNPQPEPPSMSKMPRSIEMFGLNPQPEPPSKFKRPRDWQGLNPQPEPP